MNPSVRRRGQRHPARLRVLAWLLVFGMLWAIATPRVGLALAASDSGWMEVCTGHGVRTIRVDGAAGHAIPATDGQAPAGEHCPWCLSHAKPAAPPPHDDGLRALVCVARQPAATRTGDAPPASAWRPALPRAPPLTTVA